MKKQEFIEKYGEEAYKRCLEQQRQWREQHKEERKQYQKQYQKQYYKQYYKQYREEKREYYQQYYKQWQRKKKCMFAYCVPEEVEQIENYELAKADDFKGWHIHHRLECVETGAVVNSTRQDLIDWGIYYNRPASELIFLTNSEHRFLHSRKKNREGL